MLLHLSHYPTLGPVVIPRLFVVTPIWSVTDLSPKLQLGGNPRAWQWHSFVQMSNKLSRVTYIESEVFGISGFRVQQEDDRGGRLTQDLLFYIYLIQSRAQVFVSALIGFVPEYIPGVSYPSPQRNNKTILLTFGEGRGCCCCHCWVLDCIM